MLTDFITQIVALVRAAAGRLLARLRKPLRGVPHPGGELWLRRLRHECLETRQLLSTLSTYTYPTQDSHTFVRVVVGPRDEMLPAIGMPTGFVEIYRDGTDLGPSPLVFGTASIRVSSWSSQGQTLRADYLGDINYAASSDTMTVYGGRSEWTGDIATPLAQLLDVAQLYRQGDDESQASVFTAYPSDGISGTPGYGWVSGLRRVLITSYGNGIIENLTLEVHGATWWDYAPTRIALNTINRTALFQFAQPITGPEKIQIVAYFAGAPQQSDKAYFRFDTLPGDVDQSGTVDSDDIAFEDTWVPTSDPSLVTYFDLNNDGLANLGDEAYIQAQINAGKIHLPEQLVISGNGDFGNVVVNGFHNVTLTLVNDKDTPLFLLGSGASFGSPAFSFSGGTFPGAGGSLISLIDAWTSGTVVVSFHPTTLGPYSTTVEIPYFDGSTTKTASFPLSGVAVSPASLSLTGSGDFGSVALGGSSDHTLTLTNAGQVSASSISASLLSGGFSYKGGIFPGTGGTCGSNLAAGASATIVVTFSPASVGTANSTVTVNYDSGAGLGIPASLGLSGTGGSPAFLRITNLRTLYFENDGGAPSDETFTLTNTGQWAATGIAAATPVLVYPGGTCAPTLAGGASGSMAARFYTGNGPVTFSPTLGLSYNDGNQTTALSVPTTGLNIVVTGGEVDITTPAELADLRIDGGKVVLQPGMTRAIHLSGLSIDLGTAPPPAAAAAVPAAGSPPPAYAKGTVPFSSDENRDSPPLTPSPVPIATPAPVIVAADPGRLGPMWTSVEVVSHAALNAEPTVTLPNAVRIEAVYAVRTGESITVAPPKGTVPFSSDENRDSPPVTTLVSAPVLNVLSAIWPVPSSATSRPKTHAHDTVLQSAQWWRPLASHLPSNSGVAKRKDPLHTAVEQVFANLGQ